MESYQKHFRAPELFGDYWLNAEPVSVRDMLGSIVLIDFWDYTSVHCLRALPYLKEWERKYRDYGLQVVGVHTPEFPFGREKENVRIAAQKLGISYPVVGDKDGRIWTSFGSRTWPTKFLVDKDGFIRYAHQGEGSYDQFERAIQFLVTEAGMRGELPDLTNPLRDTDVPGAICFKTTGEIRAGYLRGAIGNPEGYSPESTLEYKDPGLHLAGRIYLNGKWGNERECVRFEGAAGEKGTVTVRYEAAEVNIVVDSPQESRILVRQDGQWLQKSARGKDVTTLKDGSTSVVVNRPRMFHIVRNELFSEHLIQLTVDAPNVQIFSFSFVTSVIPEAMSAPHGIGLN